MYKLYDTWKITLNVSSWSIFVWAGFVQLLAPFMHFVLFSWQIVLHCMKQGDNWARISFGRIRPETQQIANWSIVSALFCTDIKCKFKDLSSSLTNNCCLWCDLNLVWIMDCILFASNHSLNLSLLSGCENESTLKDLKTIASFD